MAFSKEVLVDGNYWIKNSGTIFHCFFKYYFFIISCIVTPIVLEILKSVFVLTWFEPERTLFNVVAEIPQSLRSLTPINFLFS